VADQIGAEVRHLGSRQCNFETLEQLCFDCQCVPIFRALAGSPRALWFIIVDEVDQITETAQYLLLSKLDSTQEVPNTVFVFTCNSTNKLEARFVSRCIHLDFSTYGMSKQIVEFLEKVWCLEGGDGVAPDWERVVRDKGSNVRDCLLYLEAELLSRS
jgi:hypothetical protein